MSTTTVAGAPDYSRPPSAVPRTIFDTTLSLGAGNVSTPWALVEQFTGLIVEIQQITGDASLGLLQVGFSDVNGAPGIQPTYVCNWRGNKAIKLNVPVMGQRARFTFIGPASVFNFGLSVVGHGGGGHPGYGRNATVLAAIPLQVIGANASVIADLSPIREGPACLNVSKDVSNGHAYVQSFDSTGALRILAQVDADAARPPSQEFWLPPDFAQLVCSNDTGAASQFGAWVTLGRV